MKTLFGLNVVVSPLVQPVPKVQLSPDFDACSPHVKSEMNAWLLDRFGTREVCYVIGGGTLVLSPRHMATLSNL